MTKRLLAFFMLSCALGANAAPKIMLVMHGGAGTITRASMTPEKEKAYREALELALRTGQAVLMKGGTSVDAVEAAIHVLEDSPLFNAGKGAVFTHEGRNEMDSSIMRGRDRAAGAVAGVTIIRNPISAARAVMEKSPHVLMVGHGAELFATKMGLEIVDPSYFWTEPRWKALQQELMKEKQSSSADDNPDKKFGTVGAVALDKNGDLAAGTSTGGMTNKSYGRVGDSPIIGAGNYCDNEVGAACATGIGELAIRNAASFAIVERMRAGVDPTRACQEILERMVKKSPEVKTDPRAQLAFIAMNKAGEVGAAALRVQKKMFRYALVRGLKMPPALIEVKTMLG
jgi:beta-aspartyl-peptidase (threonine type)